MSLERMDASGAIEPLPWDSGFFGISIARARPASREDVEVVLERALDARVRCLYALTPGDARDALAALAANPVCRCVDLRLTLTRDAPAHYASLRTGAFDASVTSSELAQLEAIAARAHVDSRFFLDEGFHDGRCEDLYRTWIRKSIEGRAQHVLVARLGGEAVGYITLHESQGVGSIGLVALAEHARGHGLGSAMMRESLAWFAERGLERLEVVTQGRNVAAQRLYQASGFRTSRAESWFHCWLS